MQILLCCAKMERAAYVIAGPLAAMVGEC